MLKVKSKRVNQIIFLKYLYISISLKKYKYTHFILRQENYFLIIFIYDRQ